MTEVNFFKKTLNVIDFILKIIIILLLITIDIIKLPLMLIVSPVTLLMAYLCDPCDWVGDWIGFNSEFGCFTYTFLREYEF